MNNENLSNENIQNSGVRDYTAEIIAILEEDLTAEELSYKLSDYHDNDIAAVLDVVDEAARQKLYSMLDDEELADIFEYSEDIADYIEELDDDRKIAILSESSASSVVEYLDTLEEEEQGEILELIDSEVKDEVSLISSFEDDEIGSRMTTNYIAIKQGSSIKAAMSILVNEAAENDNISTLYVVDEEEKLVGAVDLKDLIIARKDTDLDSITMTSYPYVYADEKIDRCIERIKDYSEDSLPVLDNAHRLVGVIISQELTQMVDDEMGDDYAKLAGLSEEEDIDEPFIKSIGKRLPWLVILLGLGLLVSSVVGIFEQVVKDLTLIVCFQSLILAMAGNAGTQSLAVTIRVLMDENLGSRQKLFLVGKEARVSLVNGLILGSLSFLFIGFYIVLFKAHDFSYAFSVSLCTGLALAVSIVLSGVVGTVVPIIFKKLKIDPAVASGPLITTINDLVAVVSYYGLAWVLLINMFGL